MLQPANQPRRDPLRTYAVTFSDTQRLREHLPNTQTLIGTVEAETYKEAREALVMQLRELGFPEGERFADLRGLIIYEGIGDFSLLWVKPLKAGGRAVAIKRVKKLFAPPK
jgi:hypothetical protein